MKSLNDSRTLAQFVANLREGVYITSADGRILDANLAFLEIFGVASLEELAEHSASSLLVDPQRRAEETALLSATGAVREFELEIRRPDGDTRTVRKQLERQLRDLAIRDPLTGCFNRRYMQAVIADLDQADQSVGVIVADIDQFKSFNDTYGHAMGDQLLVKVGRFLLSAVRDADPVIRTGGDEFAILLPGAEADATLRVVSRLESSGMAAVPVSLTLGWASRQADEDVEETWRRADEQLIQVRVEGRARRPQR
jgi:diguanylate cyclase (GGDEF)-like protein/PAS domain S-box-containing protein